MGHAGVGARLQYIQSGDVGTLQETASSQLQLVALLALMFFYPIWILVFQNDRINGGLFGRGVLAVTSLVLAPFLLKYTKRLFGRRRIEIRRKEGALLFLESAAVESKRIRIDEIKHFKIEEYKYLTMTIYRKNHALILVETNGKEHHLCASDSRKNIESVYKKLAT